MSPIVRTPSAPRESGENRAASWSLRPVDGAYSEVVAWTSGTSWFDALMDCLATPHGEGCRRLAKVAAGTLLRVARADWLSADVATGRGVSTAHETVAAELGMSGKTVQRARELLETLGFSVTITVGRYLTRSERTAAHQVHGGRQYRAASLRALTLPKKQPVENVQLPSPREGKSLSPVVKSSPTRADARRPVAALPQQKSVTNKRRGHDRKPRPLVDQRLAAELVARLPWLDKGRHVGTVNLFLHRLGVSAQDWTANGLLAAVDQFCARTGARNVNPRAHRDPVAYLAWLINKARAAGAEPNRIRHAVAATRRAAEQAARAEEAREEAERVAAINQAEVQAVLDQMHRDFPKRIKPTRGLAGISARR
ncbi:hypothetical protein [Cryobacterium sp. Y29]|uniref:hypothetical protein n=1 Tax=Cryobacterium sp. Y29 TaxID=2048285 RepID=UPI0011B05E59|nr:hypothetical protein [Cryobacterium sp. Y29]